MSDRIAQLLLSLKAANAAGERHIAFRTIRNRRGASSQNQSSEVVKSRITGRSRKRVRRIEISLKISEYCPRLQLPVLLEEKMRAAHNFYPISRYSIVIRSSQDIHESSSDRNVELILPGSFKDGGHRASHQIFPSDAYAIDFKDHQNSY